MPHLLWNLHPQLFLRQKIKSGGHTLQFNICVLHIVRSDIPHHATVIVAVQLQTLVNVLLILDRDGQLSLCEGLAGKHGDVVDAIQTVGFGYVEQFNRLPVTGGFRDVGEGEGRAAVDGGIDCGLQSHSCHVLRRRLAWVPLGANGLVVNLCRFVKLIVAILLLILSDVM
jgi:hypothetical protein